MKKTITLVMILLILSTFSFAGDITKLEKVTDVSIEKEWIVTFNKDFEPDDLSSVEIITSNRSVPISIETLKPNKFKITHLSPFENNTEYLIEIVLKNGNHYQKPFVTITADNKYLDLDSYNHIIMNNYMFLSLDIYQKLFSDDNIRINLSDSKDEVILSKGESSSPYENIEISNSVNTIEVIYSDKIKVPLSKEILASNALLITDADNKEVSDISYEKSDTGIVIDKTYYLNLGKTYTIKGLKNTTVIEQDVTIRKYLTRDSFKESNESKGFKSVIVPAQPNKGFHFPYQLMFNYRHSFLNTHMDFESTKNTLFIESVNYGDVDYSFEDMMYKVKRDNSMTKDILRNTHHNGFAMVGIFPRLRDEGGIYTHALDRQTMFGTKEFFDQFERGNLYRTDRQFVAMQKDARMHLEKMGRNVGQPILSGFSGSALFANRLNYLHPDLAKALIVMDPPTMPFEEYNGVELKYPLGVADLEELTGEPFNKEKFLDTPQFWMVGSHDRNDGAYGSDGWGNYHLTIREGDELGIDRNQEGIDYRKAFGDDIVLRKENVRKIMKEHGFTNIEGHTYDVGHTVPWEAFEDIDKFLDKIN